MNAQVPLNGNKNVKRLPSTEDLISVNFPVNTGKITIFPLAQN
jgi:hypothetical protein